VGDALNFRTLFAPFPAPTVRPFDKMQPESLAVRDVDEIASPREKHFPTKIVTRDAFAFGES
jgi:hypothetical protein